jgi:hypothetical protein
VSRAANVTKGDNDKAVKKVVSSMQTEKNKATTKAKKPSIHERLEINKRKIQEKQGKDELERGADRDVKDTFNVSGLRNVKLPISRLRVRLIIWANVMSDFYVSYSIWRCTTCT